MLNNNNNMTQQFYKIPPHTICPYKNQAPGCKDCWHRGKEHPVAFSCALARGLKMIEINELKRANNHEIKEQ